MNIFDVLMYYQSNLDSYEHSHIALLKYDDFKCVTLTNALEHDTKYLLRHK